MDPDMVLLLAVEVEAVVGVVLVQLEVDLHVKTHLAWNRQISEDVNL